MNVAARPRERRRGALARRRGSGRQQAHRRLPQPRQSRAVRRVAHGVWRPATPPVAQVARSRSAINFNRRPALLIAGCFPPRRAGVVWRPARGVLLLVACRQAGSSSRDRKWKTAGFRRACNKRLRVAFCRLADSSRHWHPWAQALYAQARQRGHEHPRALRTLGRAWCRVVWQCWRNHTPYDPARHRALQRHITVTIPDPSGPVPDLAATQRIAGAAVTQRAARTGRARSA
jgi:hypothetical protein